MAKYLVTSALPYANGPIHFGHVAGAYLPADIYVRYLRMRGHQVLYVCGTDEHGVAITLRAEQEGLSYRESVDRWHAEIKALFDRFSIRFDVFSGTARCRYHAEASRRFFRVLLERGWVTERVEEQWYSEASGRFLPDRYLQGTCPECRHETARGDECPSCGAWIDARQLGDPVSLVDGSRPVLKETKHWYLDLPGLRAAGLDRWLQGADPERPHLPWKPNVEGHVKAMLKDLQERPITRDLPWGVPVPEELEGAEGKVLYVWFDAPIGYVSFTAKHCQQVEGDWKAYERWWKDPDCRIVHFIGEDNTIFHALTWPAMLMAERSYQLPWNVVANSFLNIKFPGQDEAKISKSRGTAIWIEEYLDTFDPDPLRYYLTAVAPEKQRTAFDLDDFITANNAILSDTLGNFVNRTLTFAHKYFDGKVPAIGTREAIDNAQVQAINESAEKATRLLESFRFRDALDAVIDLARKGNGYFSERAPWKQRKEDLAACGTTLNVCLQTVRALTTLIAPFLPFSAAKCKEMLILEGEGLPWGQVGNELPAGHQLGEPVILFKKLDADTLFGEEGSMDGH